jgi:predicted helicase
MAIVRRIENLLGLRFVKAKELNSDTFAPIDILDYCYAVLHSESYKTSCVEFLRIDFPRVPYPLNAEIFGKLISLGSKLRRIHLLDESTQHPRVADYTVKGDNIVLSVMYREDIVYENNHSVGNVYINSKW